METAHCGSPLRDYSYSPSFSSLFGFDLEHIFNSPRDSIMGGSSKKEGREGVKQKI